MFGVSDLQVENLSLYTSGVRDTQFLERLAQVLKAGKNAACQRAIGRLLASMKKRYEGGEYESLWFAKTLADFEINDIAALPPLFSPETPEARVLSRRNLNDLESKLGGFRLEVFDL